MYSTTKQSRGNKNQSNSISNSQETNSSDNTQLFTDGRVGSKVEQNVQSMANYQAQRNAIQFEQSSPRQFVRASNIETAQLATRINHSSTNMTWKHKSATVGVKVVADLDPNDKVTGSAVGGKDMYTAIDKQVSKYNNGAWARGHLLNHDLGGKGVPENLFPITSGANKRHANYVEYRVKDALSAALTANKEEDVNDQVHYSVEVKGNPSDAQFVCDWEYRDKDGVAKDSDAIPDSKGKWVIPSKLKGPGDDGPSPDPYFNSLEFPAKKAAIWHHGDRRGGIAQDTTKVKWRTQDEDPSSNLSSDEMLIGEYGYADGEMTEKEKAELAISRMKSKMDTFEKHCRREITKSIKNIPSEVYAELYRNAKYKVRLKDLKEDYDVELSNAAESLYDFIRDFVRDDKLINDLLEEYDDDEDLRPKLPPLIRETDQYKKVYTDMLNKLLVVEREKQQKEGFRLLGTKGRKKLKEVMKDIPRIVRGDKIDKELDFQDAVNLNVKYGPMSLDEDTSSKSTYKKAADILWVNIQLMERNERVRVEQQIQPNLDFLIEANVFMADSYKPLIDAKKNLEAIVQSYFGGSSILKRLISLEQKIRAKSE